MGRGPERPSAPVELLALPLPRGLHVRRHPADGMGAFEHVDQAPVRQEWERRPGEARQHRLIVQGRGKAAAGGGEELQPALRRLRPGPGRAFPLEEIPPGPSAGWVSRCCAVSRAWVRKLTRIARRT